MMITHFYWNIYLMFFKITWEGGYEEAWFAHFFYLVVFGLFSTLSSWGVFFFFFACFFLIVGGFHSEIIFKTLKEKKTVRVNDNCRDLDENNLKCKLILLNFCI